MQILFLLITLLTVIINSAVHVLFIRLRFETVRLFLAYIMRDLRQLKHSRG